MVVAEIGLSLVLLVACSCELFLRCAACRLVFVQKMSWIMQPKVPRYKYRGPNLLRFALAS